MTDLFMHNIQFRHEKINELIEIKTAVAEM